MTTVHLAILITTQAGKRQQQIDAFRQLAPVVRAEAGCLQYDLHEVTTNVDRFVLLEKWASSAALEAHDKSEHMLEADAANAFFRAGPAEILPLGSTSLA